MSTMTPQGTYDPDAYTRYVTDQVEQDRLTVDDFKKLVPPSELTSQHADAVKAGGRWIAADKKYLASLGGLPGREWKKRFPQFPGDAAKVVAATSSFFGALETLSGGRCANPEQ